MERTNRKLGAASPKSITEMKREIQPLAVEIGVASNLPFTTPYRATGPAAKGSKKDLAGLEELLRDEQGLGPTIAQLKAMRMTDGQARALYRLLTLPIHSALKGSTFIPAPGGEDEAEFITKVFLEAPHAGGMTITFDRFMAQMLQGLFDGFAAFEKVYWVPGYGDLKGKLTLKKLAYRPSESISFIVDENGGFEGFRQRAYSYGKSVDVYIPKARAFYFAAQEDENPYYGVSYFQSAFYHWDKKQKIYFTAHLAAQRSAVGTRVGTVPRHANAAAKAEFARNMANMALNQYLIMPEGFLLESLKEGGNFDFLNYLNHHNSQMSKSILGHFIDKDQGAGRGESSVVDNDSGGDDIFFMTLQAIMDNIASQINHYIIPDVIDANFKGQKYPKFTWGKLTDDQKKRVAKIFEKLATAGDTSTITPEFIRELERHMAEDLGLEIDYDEVEAREEREKEEMTAQLNAQAEADEAAGQFSLDELESTELPGDDEITLSEDQGDLIRLAQSYVDKSWEVPNG